MKHQVTEFQSDDVAPGKYQGWFNGCRGPIATVNGEALFWEFKVRVGAETLTVSGMTSTAFSRDPRCKAPRWARAIDPHFTPDSEEWDDEKAIGMVCAVEVVYFDSQGGLRSTVKDVLPWENLQSGQK